MERRSPTGKKHGYQNDPNYASFKELLEAPKVDAKTLLKDRFPLPHFVECDYGASQARFLVAALDPATTHTSTGVAGKEGAIIPTEDVNLEVFMEHLKKLAVQ